MSPSNMAIAQNKYAFDSVKHIHYLTLENGEQKPLIGTTTAIGVLNKPLTWWASGMCAGVMGWANPKNVSKKELEDKASEALASLQGMSLDKYLTLLNTAYRAHSVKKDTAADQGVSLHSSIEDFIKNEIAGQAQFPLIDDRIKPFVEWAKTNQVKFVASELHCYSEVLWAGGICDFLYYDKDGLLVLGDIKSSKEPYYSHWLQLGAYNTQLLENGGFTPDGKNIFEAPKEIAYHSVFCAGKGLDKPFINRKTNETRRAFSYTINLYKEKIWWEDAKCVEKTK